MSAAVVSRDPQEKSTDGFAYAHFLAFVEKITVKEIFLGLVQNLDIHVIRSLNSFLTWFQF